MKKKLLTVTIGIPAYNEGQNIARVIQGILLQNQDKFIIDKILVISDGSNDNTAENALSVKDKKVKVIKGNTNRGRAYRRNQIMRLSSSDILVFLDADGNLENETSLEMLILPFYGNKHLGVVGGNPISVMKQENFVAKSLSLPQNVYARIRHNVRNGNNVFGCVGAMMAIRKSLYKKIIIPNDIFADDTYIYFSCITSKLSFINARNARTIHHFPLKISTYINRRNRHEGSYSEVMRYFDKTLVQNEFFISKSTFYKESFIEFLHNPIHMLFIYMVIIYGKNLSRYFSLKRVISVKIEEKIFLNKIKEGLYMTRTTLF